VKFSVVIGNPPYQPPVVNEGGSGSGAVLWDKFVMAGIKLLKPHGYLCFVHPAKWRKPQDKLGAEMRKYQFHYLEMHTDSDGLKTFGATTRYDWYVMQNCPADGNTNIKDEVGNTLTMDITKWPFIPNTQFDLVEKLLAKGKEERCVILYDGSTYDRRKEWMATDKGHKHIYPCVNSTGLKGVRCYYSNTKDKGLFGISKLVFSDARHVVNAVLDLNGEYAMTQNAMAIPVSYKKEGEAMKLALESERFNAFLKSCRWSNFRIDYRMFQFFRKDFWREFL